MAARSLFLDFNGTLSQDEALLFHIYRDLFAARGAPLGEVDYYAKLAGHSTRTIVETWLGPHHADADAVVAERRARYAAAAADGTTIPAAARDAVRYAAAHVPVAVVSGAERSEIELVLAGADLRSDVALIVSREDVERTKPDPDAYARALDALDIEAVDALAVEDTDIGVTAAVAAGIRCVALRGTGVSQHFRGAAEVVDTLDRPLVERLLSGSP